MSFSCAWNRLRLFFFVTFCLYRLTNSATFFQWPSVRRYAILALLCVILLSRMEKMYNRPHSFELPFLGVSDRCTQKKLDPNFSVLCHARLVKKFQRFQKRFVQQNVAHCFRFHSAKNVEQIARNNCTLRLTGLTS